MYKIKTRAVGRIAAATALSFGLAASAVSVASASSHGRDSSHHDSGAFTSTQSDRVEGTVSAYSAAVGATNGSISILSKGGSTTTYTLTSATTITGLAAGATLASPDRVALELSTTTPVTVTSIKVKTPCAAKVEGTISAYSAAVGATNGSISILSKGGSTTTYTVTSATTITGLAAGATLASPDRVALKLSTTTPVTVTSIKFDADGSKCDGTSGGHKSGSRGFDGRGFGGRGSNSNSFSNGGSSNNGNFRK